MPNSGAKMLNHSLRKAATVQLLSVMFCLKNSKEMKLAYKYLNSFGFKTRAFDTVYCGGSEFHSHGHWTLGSSAQDKTIVCSRFGHYN
jgi:hypothetical protein